MTKPFVRLFLVRHGEAVANTEMRYLGRQDDPLTDLGRWQAAKLAEALAPLPITAIYSSPLQRAVDTASSIACGCGLTVTLDERLTEGSFGAWEGLTRAEVLGRGEADVAVLRLWESDPSSAPAGGESFAAIQLRVVDCVESLADRHAGESIALVSHVGPIKTLICAAMGAPLSVVHRMFLDPATISVVDWGNSTESSAPPAVLRLFNAHHHLGWDAAKWLKPHPR